MAHELDDFREKGWEIWARCKEKDPECLGWAICSQLAHLNVLNSNGRELPYPVDSRGSWTVARQLPERGAAAAKPTISHPPPPPQHTPCLSLPQELGCDAGQGKASFLAFLNPEHWETRLLGGRNGGPNHVGNGKELESRAWAGAPNKGRHKDARPHKPHNRAEEAPLAVCGVPRLGHPWMLADTQQWSGQGPAED